MKYRTNYGTYLKGTTEIEREMIKKTIEKNRKLKKKLMKGGK